MKRLIARRPVTRTPSQPDATTAVLRPADPEAAFLALTDRPGLAWLDSAGGPERLARFSILACDPIATLVTRGRVAAWTQEDRTTATVESPWRAIRRFVTQWARSPGNADREKSMTDHPFTGGVIGYFGYPLGRHIERLPHRAPRDSALPDAYLAAYDRAIVFDRHARRALVVGYESDAPGGDTRRRRLLAALHRSDPVADIDEAALDRTLGTLDIQSNFAHGDYLDAVRRVREYIAAGDIFQANISQRFATPLDETASRVDLYRRLRRANPAPFAAYLDLGGGAAVLSSSPERFLRLDGRRIQTRPIKGTRPRSDDPAADAALGRELLASEKDNAELAMIVDLLRNDIGRVSNYGTVRVTEPRTLESYPTVHHLVATVEGELHPRHDAVDLLRASFPGGSITGAPKIRSMEIIDELEPTARAVYTGAIGYFGANGTMDTNIVIRTIEVTADRLTFQVGGGIVADSDPESEYRETLHKARGLFETLGERGLSQAKAAQSAAEARGLSPREG